MRIDVAELRRRGIQFLNFNHKDGKLMMNARSFVQCTELTTKQMVGLRRDLLDLHTPFEKRPQYFCYPMCAQFWVTRERIQRHPRAYYERLLRALTDKEDCPAMHVKANSGRPAIGAYFMEAYWHYVFGEPEYYASPFESYSDIPMECAEAHRYKEGMEAESLRHAGGGVGLDLMPRRGTAVAVR